jgi:hypothetical protein
MLQMKLTPSVDIGVAGHVEIDHNAGSVGATVELIPGRQSDGEAAMACRSGVRTVQATASHMSTSESLPNTHSLTGPS